MMSLFQWKFGSVEGKAPQAFTVLFGVGGVDGFWTLQI
jgi:hypothetical protein